MGAPVIPSSQTFPENAVQNAPRRLLSIDGGGLAGLIPAEALMEMEEQLDQLTGDPQPLSRRFDLIGGTSTGAILAAGLALGLKARELRDFYLNFGPDIFKKVFLPIRFWHKYSSAPLEKHLKDVFGADTALGSDRLKTLVLLTTKNATLGSDWFFTNNRENKFYANNKALPLWQIVRASAAAPTYFPPQSISVPDSAGQPHMYEFLDGGVSSYNNPSLQVFLEATIPEYGIGWPMGVDNLLLLSLGTGFSAITIEAGKAASYEILDWAKYLLKELMYEANLQQNILMHVIGERPPQAGSAMAESAAAGVSTGAPSEAALERVSQNTGMKKLVTYQRITIGLSRERLDGLGLSDVNPEKVREMDAVDQIHNMQSLGAAVAKEQVHMAPLLRFFKP